MTGLQWITFSRGEKRIHLCPSLIPRITLWVLQGRKKYVIIIAKIFPMRETTFEKEKNALEKGYMFIIGVDEAGRGPLAGPVVAAAAILKNVELDSPAPHPSPSEGEDSSSQAERREKDFSLWKLVRDSKTLSEKQREKAFEFVHEKFHVGVGIVHSETIDRMNILEATFLAMKEAVGSLQRILNQESGIEKRKILLLVDGNMTIPNLSLDQETVVGGDGLARSIAAASIVAKVTRDRMMLGYDVKYPVYGFAKHKGYGTAAHMVALREYGPCPIHRMSFKPVRDATVEEINRKLESFSKTQMSKIQKAKQSAEYKHQKNTNI